MAVIGAALWLIALVCAYVGVDELFDGLLWEKIDVLFSGQIETEADFEAWVESFDFTLTPQAISLLLVATIASFFTVLQPAASADIARQELAGVDDGPGAALGHAVGRLPVLLLFNVVIAVIQGVLAIVGYGIARVNSGLGVLWDLSFTIVAFVVSPLLAMLWVMLYLERGLPSLRRWMRLLGRNKAATWGRVMLFEIVRGLVAVVVFIALVASPLSLEYSVVILLIVILPLTVGFIVVAQVIMYSDLVRSLESDGEATDGSRD